MVNSGAIRAAEVELRANGGNIYALAGNTGRVIEATGVANKGGRIFLTAEGGRVMVTQKVVARREQTNAPRARRAGRYSRGDRSSSTATRSSSAARSRPRATAAPADCRGDGHDITLKSGGARRQRHIGGTVLFGGDRAGGSDGELKFLPQPSRTRTHDDGVRRYDHGRRHAGDGGNVVVWSDGTTSFAGAISTQGTRGGFIETSGHVFNFTAAASMPAGRDVAARSRRSDDRHEARRDHRERARWGEQCHRANQRHRHRRQWRHHGRQRHHMGERRDSDAQRLFQHRGQR